MFDNTHDRHGQASNNDKDPNKLSVTSEPSVCVCLWGIVRPNFPREKTRTKKHGLKTLDCA